MNRIIRASVFFVLAVTLLSPAFAAYRVTDLSLTNQLPQCDGASTYGYQISWQDRSRTKEYQINTGNQCWMGNTICGISNKECKAVCTAGVCAAELQGCQYGRGSPWVQVTALQAPEYQRIKVISGRCD